MSLIEGRDNLSPRVADNHSLIERNPLTGCEKACLVGKLALWAIASLGTLFIANYPKQRVVEIWTQLTAPEGDNDETGYGSVAAREVRREDSGLSFGEDDFLNMESGSDPMAPRKDQAYGAASNLRDIGFFSSSLVRGGTTVTYMEYLGEKYPDRFIGIRELASNWQFEDDHFVVDSIIVPAVEKAIEEGKDFVFVPVVYESTRNHIVLFTINLKNPALEYFDPKGKAPGNQKLKNMNKTVEGFRSDLSAKLFKKFPKHFVGVYNCSSGEKIQRDHVSCGVFVSKFMEERLSTFETSSRSSFGLVASGMKGLNPKTARINMAQSVEDWGDKGIRSTGRKVRWADEGSKHIGEVRAIPRNSLTNYEHVPLIKGGDKPLRGILKPESSQF